jgi:SfnB family sulfur acquisition oxidoreductase
MSLLPETNVTPLFVDHRASKWKPAHLIQSDGEAIEIAKEIAAELEKGASDRDRDRILPHREIELFSQSGLWGILVPREYGGAGVSYVTLAEVVAIISAADASIGQISQNHHCIVDAIRLVGSEGQKQHYFAEILKGHRFGNAFSEAGGKHVLDINTRLERSPNGYSLSGRKFYSTGALFAHSVPVWALDEQYRGVLVIVPRERAGLTVTDDWTGFGQRTTASGTVTLDNVRVEEAEILHFYRAHEQPTGAGALAQIIHVAVDLGIGRAAVSDAIAFVRDRARAWVDSGLEKASDDPFTIAQVGDLNIKLHAAEALTRRAGLVLDETIADPSDESVARASIAVAEAKVLTTEIAILAANKLHELGGTRSTLAEYNLDRHWRNARTHTLHDPVRWKYFAIGNFYLNGIKPPRHSWL